MKGESRQHNHDTQEWYRKARESFPKEIEKAENLISDIRGTKGKVKQLYSFSKNVTICFVVISIILVGTNLYSIYLQKQNIIAERKQRNDLSILLESLRENALKNSWSKADEDIERILEIIPKSLSLLVMKLKDQVEGSFKNEEKRMFVLNAIDEIYKGTLTL